MISRSANFVLSFILLVLAGCEPKQEANPAASASASSPAPEPPPSRRYFADDRKGVVVRDWLRARRVKASDIVADSVPTAWLCPRSSDGNDGPTCFEQQLGDPPRDGLLCRQIRTDFEWMGSSLLSAWRLEGTTLRQVLRVHTECGALVTVSTPDDLLVDVDCDLAKVGLEWHEKVAIGVSDTAWAEYHDLMFERVGAYRWQERRFVLEQLEWH